MSSWKAIGIVAEGEPIEVGGVDPWRLTWKATDEPRVTVSHPQYPQQLHQLSVYEIEASGRRIKFAAGELSNGVYGFYFPH